MLPVQDERKITNAIYTTRTVRYYNPAIGRYISSDPIGLSGGLNTFGYATQNPIMRIDPRGLDSYQQCVANATAIGAAGGALLGACAALITPGGQPFIVPATGYGGEFGSYIGAMSGIAMCSEPSDGSKNKNSNIVRFPRQNIKNETKIGPPEPPEDPNHEKCLKLKNSVLATCASLTGKKKVACFAAAQATYDACMEQ